MRRCLPALLLVLAAGCGQSDTGANGDNSAGTTASAVTGAATAGTGTGTSSTATGGATNGTNGTNGNATATASGSATGGTGASATTAAATSSTASTTGDTGGATTSASATGGSGSGSSTSGTITGTSTGGARDGGTGGTGATATTGRGTGATGATAGSTTTGASTTGTSTTGARDGGTATATTGTTSGTTTGATTGGTSSTTGSSTSGGTGPLIHNDTFWKDTSGNPIYSQGGGILQVGSTYYWYGVHYNGAASYVANTKKNSDTSFNSVSTYSSSDLVAWKPETNALTSAGSGTEIAGSSWIGRLGVAYNATTKKYVLVSQYQGTAGTGEMFATSNTPNGAFTFDHIQPTVTNVANGTTGDQTLFVDDDGSAYVICSSSMGRGNLYVAPLRASDFLNVEPATRIFGGTGREGNTMFKYNGHYYFCSSDLHGWNASHTYCISATNIMGPYGAESVMANTDADFSHVTQTGFFVTVKGSSQSTVIFAGDRWSDFAGNGIGFNQWCPLTFSGTTPQFQSVTEWSLNASTGQWAVGPDNNYALNPSFEADRVAMTVPAGWTTTMTPTTANASNNVSGAHTGNWAWQLSAAAAYQASLDQTVANLPNGTYTLSAWVKSSGGQSVAQLYAKGFGGTEKDLAVNTASNAFTQKSITGIAVSNGQCQIGVATTASANQSVTVDDWSLVRTGP